MQTISWWRTHFGDEEVEKLRESVSNEHISAGPITTQFEEQFARDLAVPYAVATTSGSSALLIALMALGIGEGDEVIIPDRTWIATAHAVLLAGATVVLADVRHDLPTLDISQLRQKITSKTKAIIPVHINGRGQDNDEVQKIASDHGLLVVEDACQALFSQGTGGYLGTQSDAGCFSLGVSKLISTGQGGMVVTKNPETYDAAKLVGNHGVVDNFTNTWSRIGFNLKFTDLLSSFGLVQLTRIPARLAHVNKVYQRYSAGIEALELPFLRLIPVNVQGGEVPLYVEAMCSEKEQLMAFMESQGIQIRPFPPSLHLSSYLKSDGRFPYSDVFNEQGIYLPCGPEQPLKNVDVVLDALKLYENSR